MKNTTDTEKITTPKIKLPLLTIKDNVILPGIVLPVIAENSVSINMAEQAFNTDDRLIVCVSQKHTDETEPRARDLYRIGTLCYIMQLFRLPDGNIRVLLEGRSRIYIEKFQFSHTSGNAYIKPHNKEMDVFNLMSQALMRSVKTEFRKYLTINPALPEELFEAIKDQNSYNELFYYILSNTSLPFHKKQFIYEIDSMMKSLQNLFDALDHEIKLHELEKKIQGKVKDKIDKIQKEFFLQQQLNIINQELGISPEERNEWQLFKEKIDKLNLSPEAREKAESELKKFARIPINSPEYTVIYNYLNLLLELPWEDPVQNDIDIREARKILDDDHYGLEKVKERIIEYLAVLKLSKKIKGQIICLVGPPGVGKTSLGKSIGKALGREFVRLSLGGVRDEAEIRGHRRTYIGALPGVIIQSVKKAKVRNPLILMDEIDKLSKDFRGDPASALLEVLDPEQNNTFRDHYLDIGYDLSDVLFITTANTEQSIPQPLLDRME
ncbi:MAG: LON peptidase substrate-binding domain-containing protein, partial [Candidatus Cloacimonetes bacterium]|nr:LON peptidase substrate-binding domain-containing protein [Candidatus Cloacimonadota bacterium]